MKFLRMTGLVLAIGLGGCSTVTGLMSGSSVASQNPVVSAKTEQALTIAHLAFNGVSQLILDNTSNGLLKGATAAQVKVYYNEAGDALDVADKADNALNEPGVLSAISKANDAIASASSLVKGK